MILQLGNTEVKHQIQATSGIRQGCTLSATIFKLITYNIINELDKQIKGYSTDKVTIKSLFFADDGLILSRNEKEAIKDIMQLQKIAKEYGLEINKSKSNVMIFNAKDKIEEIGGIKVVNNMKYLGVTISDGRDMFKMHKDNKLKLSEKLVNITYSVINKSCNRLLIGRTYWKNIAIPAILYGSNIIEYTKQEIEKLQKHQNSVCRKILNAPRWATTTAMRGEIGMTNMENRINQNRIQYIRNRLNQGNQLIKLVLEELENNKGSWKINSRKQYTRIKIGEEGIGKHKKEHIKDKFREIDTKEWREEMEKKKSLNIYRKYKTKVRQDEQYDNDEKSKIWFRLKTNCLFINKSQKERCKICENGNEDICHFMLHCTKLQDIRQRNIMLQKPIQREEDNVIGKFIFDKEEIEKKKILVMKLWTKRKKILENI